MQQCKFEIIFLSMHLLFITEKNHWYWDWHLQGGHLRWMNWPIKFEMCQEFTRGQCSEPCFYHCWKLWTMVYEEDNEKPIFFLIIHCLTYFEQYVESVNFIVIQVYGESSSLEGSRICSKMHFYMFWSMLPSTMFNKQVSCSDFNPQNMVWNWLVN